jgi:hypothetical protein
MKVFLAYAPFFSGLHQTDGSYTGSYCSEKKTDAKPIGPSRKGEIRSKTHGDESSAKFRRGEYFGIPV